MGDGYCKKHGVFPFYSMQLKEKCSACAKEKNICQVCGNSLSKENK
jgi:methionyl-tRNA synthetase